MFVSYLTIEFVVRELNEKRWSPLLIDFYPVFLIFKDTESAYGIYWAAVGARDSEFM